MQNVFTCTMCGVCCQGEGGIILSPHDIARLANFMDLAEQDFLAAFAKQRNGKPALKSGEDGFCIFYKTNIGCGVHEARPDVCRAWPYFRGNLVDALSLALAKTDCPGINPHVSLEDFSVAGYQYLHKNKLIACDSKHAGSALCVQKKDLPAAAIQRLGDLP